MRRLVLLAEDGCLDSTFKEYERYALDMIAKHTKKYWTTAGRFYLTRFNPDAQAYEEYIQQNNNPFIQTTMKEQLSHLSDMLSGLNLYKDRDYRTVEDSKGELVGIVFNPMEEDRIREVVGLQYDEQAGMGEEDTIVGL